MCVCGARVKACLLRLPMELWQFGRLGRFSIRFCLLRRNNNQTAVAATEQRSAGVESNQSHRSRISSSAATRSLFPAHAALKCMPFTATCGLFPAWRMSSTYFSTSHRPPHLGYLYLQWSCFFFLPFSSQISTPRSRRHARRTGMAPLKRGGDPVCVSRWSLRCSHVRWLLRQMNNKQIAAPAHQSAHRVRTGSWFQKRFKNGGSFVLVQVLTKIMEST